MFEKCHESLLYELNPPKLTLPDELETGRTENLVYKGEIF